MRIISHRGNLNGPDKDKENTESYLIEALERGFDIEFDIWHVASKFWLGHDSPLNPFSVDALLQWSTVYMNQNFYVHCKNIWALEEMVRIKKRNIMNMMLFTKSKLIYRKAPNKITYGIVFRNFMRLFIYFL